MIRVTIEDPSGHVYERFWLRPDPRFAAKYSGINGGKRLVEQFNRQLDVLTCKNEQGDRVLNYLRSDPNPSQDE